MPGQEKVVDMSDLSIYANSLNRMYILKDGQALQKNLATLTKLY